MSEIKYCRKSPCRDCPAIKNGHIKVDNVGHLIDAIVNKGLINSCHNHGYSESNVRCEGFERFKKNNSGEGNFEEIFKDVESFIKSHEESNGDPHQFVLEIYKEPKKVDLILI